MNLKIFTILTLIVLAVIFIIQNVTVVVVNLFFWQVSISRALLIVITLLIGFLLGWIIKSYTSIKNKKSEMQAEKEPPKPSDADQVNAE